MNSGNDLNRIYTEEELNISRALELSLGNDESTSYNFLREEVVDPHKRIRQNNEPVGIKNIGNTCWFSCIMQCLFNHSSFRNFILLLQFNDSSLHQSSYLVKLQQFFSVLIGADQGYIDPSDMIDLIKMMNLNIKVGTENSFQQDAIEFFNFQLQWIESNLEVFDSSTSMELRKIFYGKIAETDNIIDFSVISVDVEISNTLNNHLDSLLSVSKFYGINQNQFLFETLPECLIFSLPHLKFDKDTGTSYKMNSNFQIQQELNLSRYTDTINSSIPVIYQLFSIIVHEGNSMTGHYISFNKSCINNLWYKMNDTVMNQVNFEDVIKFVDVSNQNESENTEKISKTLCCLFYKPLQFDEIPINSIELLNYKLKEHVANHNSIFYNELENKY
ncbi:hypothetical protein A3Q56_07242 [Intoshia linei]|uniref:Ubiquitin carboxyl-terminal hydrolase n=1 Tax=Intoshia linei TaxID=1819745 RepID=A0A177ASR9_9BILA|nr:hypothetical protein A3Q56_07242 [Intoshia linei]